MSVTPKDFLDSGKTLAVSNVEIDKRNAISRIYYGVYHLLSDAHPKPVDFKLESPKGMHKTYHAFLEQHAPNSPQRALGVKLKKLYSRRVFADYNLAQSLAIPDLALQIATADEIFEYVQNSSKSTASVTS